jgi:hypothetical protein
MKPPILREVRKIIDMEYATPPIISGKCWEARATEQIVAYYEPLIQQAKAEVAREIKERLRLSLVKNYCRTERCQSTYCRLCYGTMNPLCQFLECIIGESLKSKYGGQK